MKMQDSKKVELLNQSSNILHCFGNGIRAGKLTTCYLFVETVPL